MSENTQAPKIEFPCANYPIKVIGAAGDDFSSLVVSVVRRHAPDLDETLVDIQGSSSGRFLSVRLRILATGIEQLQAIHTDLRATGRVQMVL